MKTSHRGLCNSTFTLLAIRRLRYERRSIFIQANMCIECNIINQVGDFRDHFEQPVISDMPFTVILTTQL